MSKKDQSKGPRIMLEQAVLDREGLLISWISESVEGYSRHIVSIDLEDVLKGSARRFNEGVMALNGVDELSLKQTMDEAMSRKIRLNSKDLAKVIPSRKTH